MKVVKLFQNYFSDIEHVGKYTSTSRQVVTASIVNVTNKQ